ncbi:MAG TPA: NAD(P)-binding domain-containing protein [Caldimonas sp.]|nr:NAD(P)-binding domain-containing protein [Caldimonas sp.]
MPGALSLDSERLISRGPVYLVACDVYSSFQHLKPKGNLMKVIIIGAGNMGAAFAKQLLRAGHQVRLTSRSADKAATLAAVLPGVEVVAAAGAAIDADAVVVATGFADSVSAIQSLGDVTGKVLIDVSNPLTADYMGLTLGHTTSAAEEIARAVPEAIVVKAFNTLFAQVLDKGPAFSNGKKVNVFVASDSDRGKQTVTSLAQSVGFEVVDAGDLKNSRYLEPLGGLNVYFGYGAGLGTASAPAWMHEA